jgi:hypothetical protein
VVVVVDLEEEVVADGDDDSIELQKETTRRGCITAWSVVFGAIPNMRHGSEALGWLFVFFIHIPLLLLSEAGILKPLEIMKPESLDIGR